MNTTTHVLALEASRARTFAFLSEIDNLPSWANLFCRELRKHPDGRSTIVTPGGEILFRIDADEPTGVIDMYGGPSEDRLAHWPARVIDRPGGGSLFFFTALQYPGVSDAEFSKQCDGLRSEFVHIRRHLDGV